jgi:peptidoglycan/LPS O-acetylase OafA/YrhL
MGATLKDTRHLPALDGVRGVAVLIVVAYHTGGGAQSSNFIVRSIGLVLKAGWSGVTLFFLLSGFLITGILWDSKGAPHWWRNFYARRILRISPLYYGSLLLVMLVSWALHRTSLGSKGLWVYALYLQNVPWITDAGAGTRPLLLSHFWSLAVEEQFYLMWPLLLRRLTSVAQVKCLCLGIFVCSTLFRYSVWTLSAHPQAFNGFLLSRAGELALGGYLAMCFRDECWAKLERLAPYFTPLALVGFVAACIPGGSVELTSLGCSTAGLAFITLFYAGWIVLALKEGAVNHIVSAPWLRQVGYISYGVYIFHVLLQPLYGHLAQSIAPHAGRIEGIMIRAVFTWLLTAIIAWLSFRFFESPILGLRRHFGSGSYT